MAKVIEQTQPQTESPAEPQPRKDARRQAQSKPKRRPPYAVVLHNDPVNTIGHVVAVLRKVFRYGRGKAFLLTLRAHLGGPEHRMDRLARSGRTEGPTNPRLRP